MKRTILCCLGAALISMSGLAAAVDSVSVEAGGGSGVDIQRIGVQWKWDRKWFAMGDYHLGGYWDLQLGRWDGGAGDIADIGFTPTFRFERKDGMGPYLEGAIGFHLISQKQITPTTRTSTAFQFGDHLGVGVRFGEKGRFDLGLRLQHLSNGSIKRPNPGTNAALIRFQYHF
jgi:lipid A 3-O-deacylase